MGQKHRFLLFLVLSLLIRWGEGWFVYYNGDLYSCGEIEDEKVNCEIISNESVLDKN